MTLDQMATIVCWIYLLGFGIGVICIVLFAPTSEGDNF